MKLVIVGAGLAGHRAATALVRDGFDGELVIVGDEVHHPYDRPPLSKKLLSGEVGHDDCAYATDGLAGVSWKLGRTAVALDVERSAVTLEGGEEVAYDGLIIATGRAARQWPGLPELEGFHTLRSVDDSLALAEAAAAPDRRVVIVGGGFIGCEVAATLRQRGVEDVTIVEMAPQLMPVIGAEAGERAAAIHREHGVRVELGTSVAHFDGRGRVEEVTLSTGECLPADIVLLALGSVPCTRWLEGSGLELLRGAVLCDEHCFAVGADNVVAAGDAAAWPHPDLGEPVSIEHWTNARDMGPAAARNLLAAPGERKPFAALPTFWSDQYDVKIKSCGFLGAADRLTVVDEDADANALVVEAHRDDQIVGALTFNRNRTLLDYQRRLASKVAA